MAEASDTFGATVDAYMHSGEPTVNYGSASYLHTRVSAAGLDYLRSLMAFDVSNVKPEYVVKKAELSVYLDATSGGAVDGQLQAHEVTTAWAEKTATWNAPWVKPGGDYAEKAVGAAPINKGMVGKWITIDVTPLVAKWAADPASNHGLMLRLRKVSSITGYRFIATENWAPAHAPEAHGDLLDAIDFGCVRSGGSGHQAGQQGAQHDFLQHGCVSFLQRVI